MIRFEHVTKIYDNNTGLADVSLDIQRGEFVFLVGPSGAGKTTLIKLILKEINADSGSILVNDTDVTALTRKEIPAYRRELGIVFQDFRLLENKTVFENVAFAMEIMHHSREEIENRIPQALKLMGIDGCSERYPGELSAGEQQRAAIARAIINKPKVLICDEPTGNLDPDTAFDIMRLLSVINSTGTTILMVTHARDIVDRMSKRVITLENGRITGDHIGSYNIGSHADMTAGKTDPGTNDKSGNDEISSGSIIDFDWSGGGQG